MANRRDAALNLEVEKEIIDFESRLAMARDTFRELQTHIQTADQKVQFVLTANAFLAASISLQSQHALSLIRQQGLTATTSLTLIAGGLVVLGIIISTVFTVLTLIPRITTTPRRSLFFFADVATRPADEYVREFLSLPGEQIYEQVVYQIHANARIVETKFRWARRATLALAATLFVWVFIQVMTFLS